jgi:hypothetical protein
MVQAADFWRSDDPADGLYWDVIPANLSPARDEAASDDNKKSTNATHGAATLH